MDFWLFCKPQRSSFLPKYFYFSFQPSVIVRHPPVPLRSHSLTRAQGCDAQLLDHQKQLQSRQPSDHSSQALIYLIYLPTPSDTLPPYALRCTISSTVTLTLPFLFFFSLFSFFFFYLFWGGLALLYPPPYALLFRPLSTTCGPRCSLSNKLPPILYIQTRGNGNQSSRILGF